MRMKKVSILTACFVVIVIVVASCFSKQRDRETASGQLDFNFDIKPILSDRCFKCHGPDPKNRKAGLRLDIESEAYAVLKNSPNLHAIIPGKPDESELVKRIYATDPQMIMPPVESNLSLTDDEKALLRRWVGQGAKYKKHWAYIKPVKSALPEVDNNDWPKNEIDNFILARLEREGMKPSAEADKERLIRRVSFDLTGLPPSMEMVDKFLADKSEDAYEKIVDALLASPAYGERWANYWLDISRYGDTHGYQDDLPRVIWPWRDWVIHAFNENMPYDKFVTWQLAGDQLPDATKEQLLASAFNRNHKISQEGGIIDEEYRSEYVADRTNTFGKAFLSLSMECSRCHDHKYDPVTQKDYYSLYAFFNSVNETGFVQNLETPKPWMSITKTDLDGSLSFLNAGSKLHSEKDTIRQMIMLDSPGIRETHVLNRGAYDAPGDLVKPNVPPAILPFNNKYEANRLGLAKWLFDADNPLTARVMVNHLWQEMFGRGIVVSAEDFGNQGSIPSHPALLDWLAVDFREHGWDMKYILRKIVTSAAYRQSSVSTPEMREKDPENTLLARGPRYRMNSEMIRDNVLASSGLLTTEIGGPSVKPYQPDGIWDEVSVGDKSGYRGETSYIVDTGKNVYRRSLYTYWRRTIPPPSMITFDNPMKEVCEVRRARTSTPLQALVLLNDPQVLEASRVLSYFELKKNIDDRARIEDAFRRITGRRSSGKEVDMLYEFFTTELAKYKKDLTASNKLLKSGQYPQQKELDPASTAAMMLTIHTIYNLDETITKS
jgi:hypothetical protein